MSETNVSRWQWLRQSVMSIAIALPLLITSLTFLAPAHAAGLQSNPSIEQPAILVGPRADAPIPLYLRPAANQPNVGYGQSGASVTVLEQVASFLPEADQDAAWNHIRLEDAPYTEGWVQGRFLSLLEPETPPIVDP